MRCVSSCRQPRRRRGPISGTSSTRLRRRPAGRLGSWTSRSSGRSSVAGASGCGRRTSAFPPARGAARPGLRREEVAVLAHISTEYYVRLEQGRAPRPSGEVLAGIAGALRLTDAESDHLHVLAGTAPSRTRPAPPRRPPEHPRAARAAAADGRVRDVRGVRGARLERSRGGADGGLRRARPEDRNLARRAFLEPAETPLYGISDAAEFRHHVVRELRATAHPVPVATPP